MELEPVRAHERCGFGYDLPIDESFSHDLDGNLTQDGRFDYVWDGENRLIRATTRIDLGTPGVYDNGDRKVECVYDHMSRRVRYIQVSVNSMRPNVATAMCRNVAIKEARE